MSDEAKNDEASAQPAIEKLGLFARMKAWLTEIDQTLK